jgi:hypothetical protein
MNFSQINDPRQSIISKILNIEISGAAHRLLWPLLAEDVPDRHSGAKNEKW